MVTWQVVVLVGIVLVVNGEDPNVVIQRLKTEINKALDEKAGKMKSIEAKQMELKSISHSYRQKIADLNINRRNVSLDSDRVMDSMKNLYLELSQLYPIEDELNEIFVTLQKDKERLDLAIKWLNQDISIYKKRRADNDDNKCYDLKEMIVVKNKRRSLKADRKAEDYVYILKNKLSQAQKSLREVRYTNAELDTKIEQAASFGNIQLADLKGLLESTRADTKMIHDSYTTLKNKKTAIEKNIAQLRAQTEKIENEIKRDLKKLQQIKIVLDSFKEASRCYNSTEDLALRRTETSHPTNPFKGRIQLSVKSPI